MTRSVKFLSEQVKDCDLAILKVNDALHQQHFKATVERVYSLGKALSASDEGVGIEFVSAPNHWGQKPLQNGDRALVFLSTISGRLYEYAWRGHLWIEAIDGEDYAIFQHPELWKNPDLPEKFTRGARADPKRHGCTAFRFEAMENYLLELIRELRTHSDNQKRQ